MVYARMLGVEDGSFDPQKLQRKGKTVLCGVLTHGFKVEDVFLRLIEVDGLDATEKLLDMTGKIGSLDVVLLGGVTFGGFNIIDPVAVNESLGVPVVVVTTERPDNEAVLSALKKHFEDWRLRYGVFERLASVSPIYEAKLNPRENPVFLEVVGMEFERALEILRRVTVRGRVPEPLRVANRVAKAVSRALFMQADRK
ncbi:MAG: DUF99 family protein [Candidatus Verstraetearchaeota archaeon]|nr:DUF99 family protein [Candidatus Verstraetearchaeota archaeon]